MIISVLVTSCACDYHMGKIRKKCPSILEKDTIRVHDTIRIASVQRDTVFNYLQKDTVIIKEGRLTMKYFYNTTDSTVYLSGKCDTIRVVREIQVPVEKTVFKYDFLNSNKFLFSIILLLLCLILIAYLFKKK
jgi:hypothetical protein